MTKVRYSSGMKETYLIAEPADFQGLINDIFKTPKEVESGPLVIALTGELGAGKTAFAQELGKLLGITDSITSPTFTVMKHYELIHDQYDELFHIDAYRIEHEDELRPLRIQELFKKTRAIIVVEWPEHISTVIPCTAISLIIKIMAENKREVIVQKTK